MGNTIPHGDRLHECSSTCPEYVGPRKLAGVQPLLDHFGVEGEFEVRDSDERPVEFGGATFPPGTTFKPAESAEKPNLYVREGDQGLPVPNDHTSCQERFMDRVNTMAPARMELGLARYGTLLQPFNGRNFMQDVFEEMFDAWAYLEGVAFEREAMLDLIYDLALEGPNEALQKRARVMILSMGKALDLSEEDL